MTTKKDFKLLQFQPVLARKARQEFWNRLIDKIKTLFHRPKGYEKYRFVGWVHFTDIDQTQVRYQNLRTGQCYSYTFKVRGKLDWETVDLWLKNKR